MVEMLQRNGPGIQFNWSVQVKYSTPIMKTLDYDDEENWFRCHDDDDDDDESSIVRATFEPLCTLRRLEPPPPPHCPKA